MESLKELGREFYQFATAKDRELSRPLTQCEEQELLEALSHACDVSDIQLIIIPNTDPEPYANVEALRRDVQFNQRFQTKMLSCGHMMSDFTYTYYRFIHDVRNHVLQNKSLSPIDELLSGLDLINLLSSLGVSKYVIDFVFTDVILMNSVYEFHKTKWKSLTNGTHHRVCCFKTFQAASFLKDS